MTHETIYACHGPRYRTTEKLLARASQDSAAFRARAEYSVACVEPLGGLEEVAYSCFPTVTTGGCTDGYSIPRAGLVFCCNSTPPGQGDRVLPAFSTDSSDRCILVHSCSIDGSMNGGDDPTPEKTASRRRKTSTRNRPRSASVAKYRGKTNQQQRTGSRMRGGEVGKSGSSSAPLLPRGDYTVIAAADTGDGDPTTAGSNTNSLLQEGKDGHQRLFEHSKMRRPTTTVDSVGIHPEAMHEVDGASIDEAQDTARLLRQLTSRNQEIESRRRHLEHRCTQLEGAVPYFLVHVVHALSLLCLELLRLLS